MLAALRAVVQLVCSVPIGVAALVLASSPAAAQVPTPDAHFGFRMGADRQLAAADAIEKYFEAVAAQSDRVELVDLGRTTDGNRTLGAIVSSAANIKSLESIRTANQRLSDPRTIPPEEARKIAASHKAIVAIGAGIHASEVGGTQALNEALHTLATSSEPAVLNVLEQVVVIIIPMLNPDGHRLVTDWYRRQLDTPFEGGPMPWLYHKYGGHDLNRDGFMMNLAESRNLSRFFYTQWHPHVFLTMHEMGANGPRYFVPPNAEPVDRNYDPLIWRSAALLGSAMAMELQRDGRSGVVSNAMFDYYWPGYEDSAPLGHNTVCLLTEAAGVKVATPIVVNATDLRGPGRGLAEYRAQTNFPDPWPGGSWTLRNIVDYNLSAIDGLLFGVAAFREPIVQNYFDMGRRGVEAGRRGSPFAYVISPEQHDAYAAARLEELLLRGGVEIYKAIEPFRADGEPYPAGTSVILMSQPYRAYVKTLLERQAYPKRAVPAGAPQPDDARPYDAAGWTLPEQMGVAVVTIERSFEPPSMQRLTEAAVAPASVWGERRPGFYVVDARGAAGAIAANRLAAGGLKPAFTTSPLDAGGFQYAAGSLVVPYSREAEAIAAKIATDLGLRVDGVRGRVPSSARPVGPSRIALYKPYVENADEGWTRWLLEQYEFKFASLVDADVQAGNLRAHFDAIVLPSGQPDRLLNGHTAEVMPAPYAGGLGERGMAALRAFVEAGGTLVCLDQSCGLVIRSFSLPVADVAKASKTLFVPGSLVRVETDPSHPLAMGLLPRTAGFFAFSSAYEPAAGSSLTTAAKYGTGDILISGWADGADTIAGRSAVAEVSLGTGRVVLLGFRVQHRAQSLGTFRFLFNAIFTS